MRGVGNRGFGCWRGRSGLEREREVEVEMREIVDSKGDKARH